MQISNSETQRCVTTSRRGPIELPSERRLGRADQPASRREMDFPARPSHTFTERAVAPVVKTRGEIEAGICAGITRLQHEYLGRGPKDIHAHLITDLLVVRLFGVLTVIERQLVTARDGTKGWELVKQVRTQLIGSARPVLEALVENEAGVPVVSLLYDLSIDTGEEMIVFTLAAVPGFREAAKKGK